MHAPLPLLSTSTPSLFFPPSFTVSVFLFSIPPLPPLSLSPPYCLSSPFLHFHCLFFLQLHRFLVFSTAFCILHLYLYLPPPLPQIPPSAYLIPSVTTSPPFTVPPLFVLTFSPPSHFPLLIHFYRPFHS